MRFGLRLRCLCEVNYQLAIAAGVAAIHVRGVSCAVFKGAEDTPAALSIMSMLLSKEHRITEKGMMEFQPFGKRPDGGTIHDLSGIVIKADIELLEKLVSSAQGPAAAPRAVEELVRRLNERIPNRAYHVTAEVLRNPWNGYSNEFVAFLAEFCIAISGEPRFMFEVGRQQAISPIIQVLGRPFSVPQIYKMSAYFSQRYAKDSFSVESVTVSDRSAILRMTFNQRMDQHFGRYRRRCAWLWCDAVKGYFVGVPEQFHKLPPAVVKDLLCMAKGDDRCEWEVTWSSREKGERSVDRPYPWPGEYYDQKLSKKSL
jgi:hypothetical protein